jgi:acyl-CoA synthetase (AMP-forming)/AMP-acid ligase II
MAEGIEQPVESDPRNIRELLERRAEAAPGRDFLFSEADGRRYTYAEFDAAASRMARMLAAHGIGKGDGIGLLMPSGAVHIIAYFACFKLKRDEDCGLLQTVMAARAAA